jgi:hypothetical protein
MKKVFSITALTVLLLVMAGCQTKTITEYVNVPGETVYVDVPGILTQEEYDEIVDENKLAFTKQLEDIYTVLDEAYAENTASNNASYEERLAVAIEELEPVIKYVSVVTEVEVEKIVYRDVPGPTRTNTVYVNVPGETVYVTDDEAYQALLTDYNLLNASIARTNSWMNDKIAQIGYEGLNLDESINALIEDLEWTEAQATFYENQGDEHYANFQTEKAERQRLDKALATANASIAKLQAQLAEAGYIETYYDESYGPAGFNVYMWEEDAKGNVLGGTDYWISNDHTKAIPNYHTVEYGTDRTGTKTIYIGSEVTIEAGYYTENWVWIVTNSK